MFTVVLVGKEFAAIQDPGRNVGAGVRGVAVDLKVALVRDPDREIAFADL